MDIIKEAFEFAKKIQKTEQYLKLKEAKKFNDDDEQLQFLIKEFNMVKLKFEHVPKNFKENNKVDVETKELYQNKKNSEKLNKLYDKIMENKNMVAFNEASDNMNSLMNKINRILVAAVNGKDIENFNKFEFENDVNCAGNCHDCSGCF